MFLKFKIVTKISFEEISNKNVCKHFSSESIELKENKFIYIEDLYVILYIYTYVYIKILIQIWFLQMRRAISHSISFTGTLRNYGEFQF